MDDENKWRYCWCIGCCSMCRCDKNIDRIFLFRTFVSCSIMWIVNTECDDDRNEEKKIWKRRKMCCDEKNLFDTWLKATNNFGFHSVPVAMANCTCRINAQQHQATQHKRQNSFKRLQDTWRLCNARCSSSSLVDVDNRARARLCACLYTLSICWLVSSQLWVYILVASLVCRRHLWIFFFSLQPKNSLPSSHQIDALRCQCRLLFHPTCLSEVLEKWQCHCI